MHKITGVRLVIYLDREQDIRIRRASEDGYKLTEIGRQAINLWLDQWETRKRLLEPLKFV